MTSELRESLLELLSRVDEAVEPDTAKIHRFLGSRAPCLVPAQKLCGVSGVCAATSCHSPRYRVALQPLRSLPRHYQAPRVERLASAALHELSKLGKGVPVFTDYRDLLRGRRCRAQLGCTPAASRGRVLEPGESLGLEAVNPRLIVPQLLAARRLRAARSRVLSAPWLAVQTRPGSCLAITCLTGDCSVATAPGRLEVLEGRLLVEEERVCSPTRLAIDSAMSRASASDSRGVYALSPLLPLWARVAKTGRKEAKAELLVWNPAPRSYLAVIVTRGYRVRLARAAYSLGEGWEQLAPEYDRVSFPVRRLGLALLYLELAELPPLLKR